MQECRIIYQIRREKRICYYVMHAKHKKSFHPESSFCIVSQFQYGASVLEYSFNACLTFCMFFVFLKARKLSIARRSTL